MPGKKLGFKEKIIFGVLAVLTLISVAIALISKPRYWLISASTCFILTAIFALVKNKSIYGILTLIALIFCWFGDFSGYYSFNLGLIAFALAHLFFISAFLIHGINRNRCFFALGAFLLSGIVILYWLYPFVSMPDKIFVIIYMVIITAMVVLGSGTKSGSSHILISIGALIFYISDIFVARWRFVDKSSINAFFCYPLYYTSCLILAFSILAYKRN